MDVIGYPSSGTASSIKPFDGQRGLEGAEVELMFASPFEVHEVLFLGSNIYHKVGSTGRSVRGRQFGGQDQEVGAAVFLFNS